MPHLHNSAETASYNPTEKIDRETLRNEVVEELLNPKFEWNGQKLENLPGLLKWMMSYAEKEGKPTKEEMTEDLLGYFRGVVGERVSALISINEAETVYTTMLPNQLDTLQFGSMAGVEGGPNKYHLINQAVYKQTREALQNYDLRSLIAARNKEIEELLKHPDAVKARILEINPNLGTDPDLNFEGMTADDVIDWLEKSGEPRREAFTEVLLGSLLQKEIAQGYSVSRPGEDGEVGITYDSTVLPDAIVRRPNGETIGVMEVKMYEPYEFDLVMQKIEKDSKILGADGFEVLLTNEELSEWAGRSVRHHNGSIKLGVDIQGQYEMMNFVRTNIEQDPETGKDQKRLPDCVFILRVPEDIPTEDLKSLGQRLRDSGRRFVAIQKIPFTAQEINDLTVETLGAILPIIEKSPEGNAEDNPANVKGMQFSKADKKLLREIYDTLSVE